MHEFIKTIAVLSCFTVLLFNFVSIIYPGLNYLILLHITSLLLLAFVAYIFFPKWRSAVRNKQSDNQTLLSAMESIFMEMPVPVLILQKDFTIIDVNSKLIKDTGAQPETSIGRKCYDVLGQGFICHNCAVQKALISGKAEHSSKLEYKIDEKQQFGKQTAIPIKDRNGDIMYIYEIVIDITQEVNLERENAEILMDLVSAMVHLIESRDPSTGTHSFNVQSIALAIGRSMGLTDRELNELSIASILHDIGKIGISESILNKPERLTEYEFLTIKMHPQIGYDAIKHIKRLQEVSEAILDHHEYYNGCGYPRGKKNEELSTIAKILSVADVFEALTADRVYRPAMSEQQAIEIVQEGKGQQFDPEVVDALLAVLNTDKEGFPSRGLRV